MALPLPLIIIGALAGGGLALAKHAQNTQNDNWVKQTQAETASKESLWRSEDLEREAQWRNEDIERSERWRAEDIERNSFTHKLQEVKAAGFHGSAALHGAGAGGGTFSPAITRTQMTGSGGRIPTPRGHDATPMSMLADTALRARELGIMAEKVDIEREMGQAQANLWNAQANVVKETGIEEARSRIISSNYGDKLTHAQMNELLYNLERSQRLGIRTDQTNPIGMAGEAAAQTAIDLADVAMEELAKAQEKEREDKLMRQSRANWDDFFSRTTWTIQYNQYLRQGQSENQAISNTNEWYIQQSRRNRSLYKMKSGF